MDQCSDCVFFRADTCRRAPPVRLPRRFDATATSGNRVRQEEITWGWPAVSVSDWCGSFIAKAAEAVPGMVLDAARLEAATDAAELAFDHAYRYSPPGEGVSGATQDGIYAAAETAIRTYLAAAPQPLSTGEVK